MDTPHRFLEKLFTRAIQEAFPDLAPEEAVADVAPCSQEEFGHYQCNSAMRLAKKLKKSPKEIASTIADRIDKGFFEKIEIAGPGFINLSFSAKFLAEELVAQSSDSRFGASFSKKERIIVEFSSPNIAKELHVGHIRSTIIGDCLARAFEFLGHDVLRLNHLGDWGTQFGMLIAYLRECQPKVLAAEIEPSLGSLMRWYKEAKARFDVDQEFKKRSQMEVVRLQAEDSEAIKAWKIICDISRKGFQKIYDFLDVQIEERGESFYNPFLKEVVEEFEKKGLVKISNGAKCIYLEGFQNRDKKPLPLMIQKSDGGYNYDTTDLAAIRHRIFEEKADRIIVVVDIGQSLHFQMIFKAAEKIGWLDPEKVRADHVGFGLVLGADGKKFKTRSGDSEKLIDLLETAIEKARGVIEEKNPDLTQKELEHAAHVIGIGAIKYADLSSLRTKDYTFSYDKMLQFEGNTAVFLLYAYVRIQGIRRKAGEEKGGDEDFSLTHPTEISLALHLRRFGEVLEQLAIDLLPNRLTDYLYTLAEKFHALFRDCRVIGSKEEKSRLFLLDQTGKILKQGLDILGLKTLDKM